MLSKYRLLIVTILLSVAIVVLFALLLLANKYVILDKLYRVQTSLQNLGLGIPNYLQPPIISVIENKQIKDLKLLNPPTKDYMKYCLEDPYPFFLAAWVNNEEAINYYLDMGIPINTRHPLFDITILHFVSDPELALNLIAKGADINAVDKRGDTPFLHIIRTRNSTLETVKEYIRLGADINYHNPNNYDTVLTYAVTHKGLDLLNFFLEMPELKWTLKGKYGADLVRHATNCVYAQKEDFEKFALLLENGLEINSRDSEGVPALFHIIMNPENDFFDSAIKYNIDPHIVDVYMENALTYCTHRFIETKQYSITYIAAPETIVNRCIAVGMSINEQNADGDTALHIAARCSSEPMIEALLKSGADVNIKNKKNETPLSIAQKERKPYIHRVVQSE